MCICMYSFGCSYICLFLYFYIKVICCQNENSVPSFCFSHIRLPLKRAREFRFFLKLFFCLQFIDIHVELLLKVSSNLLLINFITGQFEARFKLESDVREFCWVSDFHDNEMSKAYRKS